MATLYLSWMYPSRPCRRFWPPWCCSWGPPTTAASAQTSSVQPVSQACPWSELSLLSRLARPALPGRLAHRLPPHCRALQVPEPPPDQLNQPVVTDLCRRRSTRLTGVVGGLLTALACLFTSFATQFHQLVLSFGILHGNNPPTTSLPTTTGPQGWGRGWSGTLPVSWWASTSNGGGRRWR